MRCFTVRENVHRGITVQKDGEQPAVILGTGEESVLPLDTEMADYFIKATEVLGTSELTVAHATLRGNPPYLCKAPGRDPHALVLVQVPVPDGGKLWLEGTGFTEVDDSSTRFVKREQHPFPPPGVIPVDASGGDLLVIMTKRGSSFRICRSGDLQGASPVLIVTWSGGKLRVVVPRKYQASA